MGQHVDDMIITGSDTTVIAFLKQHLQSQFKMKDLGLLRYFLGTKVAYSSRDYLLSQQMYFSDILKSATLRDLSLLDSPSVFAHMELNLKLAEMTVILYHSPHGIGNLLVILYICIGNFLVLLSIFPLLGQIFLMRYMF